MRILSIEPSGDPGILSKSGEATPERDPIVRNDLSPCVE
jgi:hypothetical protein